MSTGLELLSQQLGELNETIKNYHAGRGSLNEEEAAQGLRGILEGAQLLRHGEAQAEREKDILVGPPGFRVPKSPMILEGKFAGMKQADLQFVNNLLIAAGQFTQKVRPPSEALQKALTADGDGTGDQLVPTAMAAELWQDFFLASRIVSNLPRINMPTDPFDYPLGLGDVTWRKGTQNTVTTASDPATAKSTLTSTELVAEINWSYNLDEDAIVAVLPALRQRLAISGPEAMDAFVLNADATNAGTGNINLDDADPADDKYYLSNGQDGIRHQWLVDNSDMGIDAGGDALTDSDILGALALMGKYAVVPERLAMITDIYTYIKGLMGLDGVQTLDKYGPMAVLLTGELARYRGIPIVPSASAPKTEADGKVSTTSGNNTLGQLSIAHRDMWGVGFRREMLIEVDRDIQKRSLIMVVSFRIATASHGTRASNEHTSGVYNISLS
jgi:hypothetical protein